MRLPERDDIFRNHGEQNPLLRVLLLAAGFLLISMLLAVPLMALLFPMGGDVTLLYNLEHPFTVASQWAALAAAVVAIRWMTARRDRQRWEATGLWLHPGWQREALSGLALGAGLIAAIFLVLVATGIAGTSPGAGPARAILLGIFVMVPVALTEELLFRGYLLRNLAQAWGSPAALAVSAVIFGVVHSLNPNPSALALLSITLTGILMGYAYLQSGSLWFPVGFHFAWNFTQGSVLGMPVSGLGVPGLIRAHLGTPYWLSGGPFGPESSVLATVAMLLGIGYVVWRYGGPASLPRPGVPEEGPLPEE